MKKVRMHQYDVDVFCTTSRADFTKKTGFSADPKDCCGLCANQKSQSMICIGLFNNSISTLTHEIHHALVALNFFIGSPMNADTEEHNAYMAGYLMEQMLKKGLVDFTKPFV